MILIFVSHKKIIEYCNRPFSSVEEMNIAIIENWNKVIKSEDRVFMCGDFALCGKDKIIEIGNKLKGRKILILGNHDGASLSTYYNAGFEMVSRFPIFFEEKFIISHKPIPNINYINIHGHLHQKNIEDCVDFNKGEYPYINISVDQTNFYPVSFEKIVEACNYKR